ncbi:MAG: glutamate--cysteine ligase [Myxococcales bacterium]|nr:glutamate--cysteine ligase [Myxococcales bacterium]
MAHGETTSPILENPAQLRAPFAAAIARGGEKIGLEAEKFGVTADGAPLRYEHVRAMLDELATRFGWKRYFESEGGPLLALERNHASITLEPGSQLELSGAPFEDLHSVADEVEQHRRELAALETAKGVRWLAMGYHPTATEADLDWVPKSRYPIMREYLPTRGARGLEMMRRTATVQANFDFSSDQDAIKKLQVSLALAPIAQAMFANSPLKEKKRVEFATWRGQVWLDVDPDRTGLLPTLWREGATIDDYIAWAKRVPMFVVKRGDKFLRATHLTFEQFMRDGLEGHRANESDWETHLNTLFPEVRLKRTLEVRSADCVPARLGTALPALFTGILYDPTALDAAHRLLVPLGHDAYANARLEITKHALASKLGARRVGDFARDVLAIAHDGLARRARRDAAGRDETVHLAELRAIVDGGKSVGQALLGGYEPATDARLDELASRVAY